MLENHYTINGLSDVFQFNGNSIDSKCTSLCIMYVCLYVLSMKVLIFVNNNSMFDFILMQKDIQILDNHIVIGLFLLFKGTVRNGSSNYVNKKIVNVGFRDCPAQWMQQCRSNTNTHMHLPALIPLQF